VGDAPNMVDAQASATVRPGQYKSKNDLKPTSGYESAGLRPVRARKLFAIKLYITTGDGADAIYLPHWKMPAGETERNLFVSAPPLTLFQKTLRNFPEDLVIRVQPEEG